MPQTHFVTGAAGLVGSHLVERLRELGKPTVAVVRADSDCGFLQTLDVEIRVADFADAGSLRAALNGADIVHHCAARVSDWGPWSAFQAQIIDLTANVLAACRDVGVSRFLQVSSSRVYGHPRRLERPLDESAPLGQRLWRLWDYYPRAKIAAEQAVRGQPIPWTILRPAWVWGERDRNSAPRLIDTLRRGHALLIGSGTQPIEVVAARDVAEAMILAAEAPAAVGQAYNLSSGKRVTQLELYGAFSEALGLAPPRFRVPFPAAFAGGFAVEAVGKLLGVKRTLRITRHAVTLLAGSCLIDSSKAQRELQWRPERNPLETLRRTAPSLSPKAAPALPGPLRPRAA